MKYRTRDVHRKAPHTFRIVLRRDGHGLEQLGSEVNLTKAIERAGNLRPATGQIVVMNKAFEVLFEI